MGFHKLRFLPFNYSTQVRSVEGGPAVHLGFICVNNLNPVGFLSPSPFHVDFKPWCQIKKFMHAEVRGDMNFID